VLIYELALAEGFARAMAYSAKPGLRHAARAMGSDNQPKTEEALVPEGFFKSLKDPSTKNFYSVGATFVSS
jgi:hypothetical protein